MHILRLAACAFLVFALGTPEIIAQVDWSRFRGPNGQGAADCGVAPPVELSREDNLLWSTPLSLGHSSPCLTEGSIFLTGADGNRLITYCLDRKTGEVRWTGVVETDAIERTHEINTVATPTPTTDGERVYSYFGSFGLVCYDIEGNEKWTRRIDKNANLFGSAASPILADGKLVLCCDKNEESFLEVLQPETGETIWRVERTGFKSGWSTPIVRRHDKGTELVVYGIWWLTGYDLDSGEERWSVPGLADEPCITPTLGDGIVFVTSYNMKTNPEVIGLPEFDKLLEQYDKNADSQLSLEEVRENKSVLSRFDSDGEGDHPLRGFFRYLDEDRSGNIDAREWRKMIAFVDGFEQINGLVAIQPGSPGGEQAAIKWVHSTGVPECPSPLYSDGRLYLIKNGGILSCLDATEGDTHYQLRIGAGGPYYASPVICNDKIYLTSARGTVSVIRAGDRFDLISQSELAERIMATPAIAEGVIYIRTETGLLAFGQGRTR